MKIEDFQDFLERCNKKSQESEEEEDRDEDQDNVVLLNEPIKLQDS
jgi:hypothetical protein